MKYFEIEYLEEAERFIRNQHPKIKAKIYYNIQIAEQTNNHALFKKLKNDIWEFRTSYFGMQFRLLAFWDKTDSKKTLVLATHGFIKKVDKVPENEIWRAEQIRRKYFELKLKS